MNLRIRHAMVGHWPAGMVVPRDAVEGGEVEVQRLLGHGAVAETDDPPTAVVPLARTAVAEMDDDRLGRENARLRAALIEAQRELAGHRARLAAAGPGTGEPPAVGPAVITPDTLRPVARDFDGTLRPLADLAPDHPGGFGEPGSVSAAPALPVGLVDAAGQPLAQVPTVGTSPPARPNPDGGPPIGDEEALTRGPGVLDTAPADPLTAPLPGSPAAKKRGR